MDRQRDNEGRALPDFAPGCNGSAVAVGDAAANGQADTGPFIFTPSVQSLKHYEDLLRIPLLETDAVVLNGEFAKLLARD